MAETDLISRQDAIDLMQMALEDSWESDYATDRMNELPSAKPERKKGKWKKSYADHEAFGIRPFFRYCSECHEVTVHPYNFCPNCGAYMRGEQNGND